LLSVVPLSLIAPIYSTMQGERKRGEREGGKKKKKKRRRENGGKMTEGSDRGGRLDRVNFGSILFNLGRRRRKKKKKKERKGERKERQGAGWFTKMMTAIVL